MRCFSGEHPILYDKDIFLKEILGKCPFIIPRYVEKLPAEAFLYGQKQVLNSDRLPCSRYKNAPFRCELSFLHSYRKGAVFCNMVRSLREGWL